MDLEVRLADILVGTLSTRGNHASTFRCHDTYVQMLERPVLGQAFEDDLERTWRRPNRLPEFFSNLLPEGVLRKLIADQSGIPEQREAHLLARLGEDLPGAVIVRPLTELDQEAVAETQETQSSSDTPLRFSLAGIQAKFSALRDADKFVFPARGVGGDWIVKLPDRAYARVPENEFSMMAWAAQTGIDVPEIHLTDPRGILGLPTSLVSSIEEPAYSIQRFDRGEGGRRIHIEDFAQVFTMYPEDKYDHFNYESICNVIAQVCGEASLREYVRRLVFMVVSGNADMHLKNWSLRYPDGRRAELSPAYDFVSTVVYPDLARELALRFSKSTNFDAVQVGHFRRMFQRMGRDPVEVERWVAEDLERTLTAWTALREQLPLTESFKSAIEAHRGRLALVP